VILDGTPLYGYITMGCQISSEAEKANMAIVDTSAGTL
jgi:hypothetical protein